jgi:hypothetical protein
MHANPSWLPVRVVQTIMWFDHPTAETPAPRTVVPGGIKFVTVPNPLGTSSFHQ